MPPSLPVVLGIASMFLWAGADILAAIALKDRKSGGTNRTLFYTQLFSLAFSAPVIFLFQGNFVFSPENLLLFLLCGALNALGFFFFYRAIERGAVSIAVPIGYSWSVLTAVLVIAVLGERPSPFVLLGAVLAAVGGVISELKKNAPNGQISKRAGIDPFLAVLFWGICYFLYDYGFSKGVSFAPAIFALRLFSFFFVWALLGSSGKAPDLFGIFRESRARIFAAVGFLELVATTSYSVGISIGESSVVAPLSAGAPAIVVMYSILFFREKPSPRQWIGIALTLSGIALCALA